MNTRLTRVLPVVLVLVTPLLAALPAVAAPAPVLTSVSPSYALNTSYTALMIWGTGFLGSPGNYHASNPSITLRKSGQPDISVTGTNVYLYPAGDEIGINNFPLTGAAPGAWDIVVTNNDGQSGTLPGAFTVLTSYPTPTVTSVSPDSAPNTGSVLLTVTGTGFFVPPAPNGPLNTVKLTHGTPYGSITATNVNVLSDTLLNCTVDVTGAGWGTGSPWNVAVQAPSNGATATLNNAFTVTAPAPTLTSISPTTGTTTATTSLTLNGTNFMGTSGYNTGNPQVTMRQAGQADRVVSRGNVYLTNATRLTCTLPTNGAALGAWDIIVTNYDGQASTLPAAFTVYATPKPTVTAITPTSGTNDGTVAITNLAGTGFLAGSTVKLTAAGQPDITATAVTIASAAKITCSFDLTGAAAGARDVTVTLPDGQTGTKTGAFTVYNRAPVVNSITPNNGANNTSVAIASISGSGFEAGATVKLQKTGQTDITATNVNVVSPTQITCTFPLALPSTGVAGAWDVVVTNPGGVPGKLTAAFTVTYPAPTVSAITPPYAVNNAVAAITVTGTGFLGKPSAYDASNPALTLRKAGQPDITVSGASIYMYPGGTQIGTNAFPLSGATQGVYDVVVTNSDGQSATLPGAFTVIGPYATPTVTGITPGTAANTGPVSVTITGTNFFVPPAPGGPVMSVKLAHGTPYGSLTATNVSVVSDTQLTCTFDLTNAGWGANSPWNVTVQAPSSGPSGTLNNAFTVTASAPTITAITPAYGATTANASVTIDGSNFMGTSGYNAGNPQVTMRKAGQTDRVVARGSVYLTNSGRISCTLPVSGAALGAWDIIVTNYDDQAATLPAAFTVYATAKPTVTSIAPVNGLNNGLVNITNLAGTGFLAGSTVKLTAAGQPDINATAVSVVSATKITCSFDLTGAVGGARDVTVTLPDGQLGTKAGAFSVVTVAPTVTAITPASAASGATVDITDLSGTGFLPGASVKLQQAGQSDITATGVTVVSTSRLTGTIDLTGAATGAWDVVVTNSDGKSGLLSAAFTVLNAPPTVLSATYIDATHVDVLFDKALDPTTAQTVGNYSIFPGLAVSAAVLDADTVTVHLTVAAQTQNTAYTVLVSGVQEAGGTAIGGKGNSAAWNSPDAPPTVTSATYVDPTHVDVLFDKPMEQATAEVAGNYGLSPALSVSSAVLDADTVTVHLTTAVQTENTLYTVTVSGVNDALGTVIAGTGNSAQWTSADLPPTVTSATYVDPTHVDVLFNKSLEQASAETAGNYGISPALAVSGAALDPDGVTVHLTTAMQSDGATYTVTVSGVKDSLGTAIGATGNTAQWSTGNWAPTVTGATYVDSTHVNVVFSKAVEKASAEVAANYAVAPALNVTAAALDVDGVTVHLTTDTQTDGASYTVTVSNVNDTLGTPIGATGNTAQWSTGDWPPTVLKVKYLKSRQVDVIFSKALEATTAQNVRNYSVSPALKVSGAVLSANGTSVRLTTAVQTSGTNYTVTVVRVKSVGGTAVSPTANSASWLCAPTPQVSSYSPRGTGVSRSAQVRVVFTEDMARATVQGAFSLSPAAAGTFTWSGKTMYYTPGAPLAASTTYTVKIDVGAKSKLGIALAAPFTWTFSTGTRALAQIAAVAAPTSTGAQFTVNLAAAGDVEIRIQNMAGREVATLSSRSLPAGLSTLVWDGKGSHGTAVPPGSYLACVTCRGVDGSSSSCLVQLLRQ